MGANTGKTAFLFKSAIPSSFLVILARDSALATCVLGADGEGQTMEPPARGSYWLIGATPLGSGFVFEKAISVQTGKELFILNSADQAKER